MDSHPVRICKVSIDSSSLESIDIVIIRVWLGWAWLLLVDTSRKPFATKQLCVVVIIIIIVNSNVFVDNNEWNNNSGSRLWNALCQAT